jgi:hypothetical protein
MGSYVVEVEDTLTLVISHRHQGVVESEWVLHKRRY